MTFVHIHENCALNGRRCTDLGLDPERDYCTSGQSRRVLFDGETESRIVPADTLREVSGA